MTKPHDPEAVKTPHQILFGMCSRHLQFGFLFSAVVGILNLVPTLYMLQIYDRVLASKSDMTLLFLSLFTVLALLLLAYIDGVKTKILASLGGVLEQRLWREMTKRNLAERSLRSGQTSLTNADFETLKTILTGSVASALLDLPWSLLYIAIAFVLHWAIGLFALISFATFILLAIIYEALTSDLVSAATIQSGRQQAFYAEVYSQRRSLRSLGITEAIVTRLVERRSEMLSPQKASQAIAANYGAVVKFVRLCLQSGALGLAALLAIKGNISPGAIFASSMLASRALAPMDGLLTQWRSLAQIKPIWQKLKTFLSASPKLKPTELPKPEAVLHLDRVSLLSPDRNRYLIRDITLQAGPGVLAIIGPTGSGKSVLLQIIGNALRPDGGTLRLGATDYELWEPERLGKIIGYVSHDYSFLPGTIKDNISRFATTVDDAQVVLAAQIAGVHDMIMRMSNGYDTVLGFEAQPLSSGQAQRIAYARAVFGAPRLYIFDDPTAGLDGEGEASLLALIKRLKASGSLIVLATHRASLISVADHVLAMREGRCVTQGSPAEVLSHGTLASASDNRTEPPPVRSQHA